MIESSSKAPTHSPRGPSSGKECVLPAHFVRCPFLQHEWYVGERDNMIEVFHSWVATGSWGGRSPFLTRIVIVKKIFGFFLIFPFYFDVPPLPFNLCLILNSMFVFFYQAHLSIGSEKSFPPLSSSLIWFYWIVDLLLLIWSLSWWLQDSYAVLITAQSDFIPIWGHIPNHPQKPCFWDYHVVFILPNQHKVNATQNGYLVYDSDYYPPERKKGDSPQPAPFEAYCEIALHTYITSGRNYHRYFRIIPGLIFLFFSFSCHLLKYPHCMKRMIIWNIFFQTENIWLDMMAPGFPLPHLMSVSISTNFKLIPSLLFFLFWNKIIEELHLEWRKTIKIRNR